MKILDTSLIVDPGVQQPFTGPSLDFVEDAYKEIIAELTKSLLVDSSKVTVLYGCVNSTPGGTTFTISAGAIYYNGEIYIVPAATLTTSGNVVVANLVDTDTLGPQTFSDGIARITSHNRTAVWALGASGSGTISGTTASDYNNRVNASISRTFTPVVSAQVGTYVVIGSTARVTIFGRVAIVTFQINLSGGNAGNSEIYIDYPSEILAAAIQTSFATGFTSPGGDIDTFFRVNASIKITIRRLGNAAFGVLTNGTEFNGELIIPLG